MLVKILGAIDIVSAIAFLGMIFGISYPMQFILFCAGLLLLKGLFIITGDVLSFIDLFASLLLFVSLFLALPIFLLWICAFLLIAKGFVSFL